MASTGADQGRGLPSFRPLARTDLLDSNRLMVPLWQQKASLSRLMVVTQQVGENMTRWLFHKEGLTWVWLAESCGYNIYQKLLWLILSYKLFSSKRDIEPTTESTSVVWPKRITDQPIQHPNHSNLGYSNLVIGVSTAIMTVLHSIEVVHIPHESRLSLVARHPLIQWNTFTHFWGVR
jgi:hypothetical protein